MKLQVKSLEVINPEQATAFENKPASDASNDKKKSLQWQVHFGINDPLHT
jgi:hypothetical protein